MRYSKMMNKEDIAITAPTGLNPYQQIRWYAVENKTSAYRTWVSRTRAAGLIPKDSDYIRSGYNNIKENYDIQPSQHSQKQP
jgi:hypothetical protein